MAAAQHAAMPEKHTATAPSVVKAHSVTKYSITKHKCHSRSGMHDTKGMSMRDQKTWCFKGEHMEWNYNKELHCRAMIPMGRYTSSSPPCQLPLPSHAPARISSACKGHSGCDDPVAGSSCKQCWGLPTEIALAEGYSLATGPLPTVLACVA